MFVVAFMHVPCCTFNDVLFSCIGMYLYGGRPTNCVQLFLAMFSLLSREITSLVQNRMLCDYRVTIQMVQINIKF